MAQLTLLQCDNCGYATFTTTAWGFINGAELKFEVDQCTWRICENCVEALLSRREMYELTGDAAKPCKARKGWPPEREQSADHPRSS